MVRITVGTAMPACRTARHGLGAAAVAGRIYVISGEPTPGASASAVNEIFVPVTVSAWAREGRGPLGVGELQPASK
jgi:hypothetical protein